MPYQRRAYRQGDSLFRPQALLGQERLESRALLAGLINLPDCVLPQPSNIDHAATAEIGQLVSDRLGANSGQIHQDSPPQSIAPELADSIWRSAHNWLKEMKTTPQDDTSPHQTSSCVEASDEKQDAGNTELGSEGGHSAAPAQPVVAQTPSTEEAQPLEDRSPPAALMPIVAVPPPSIPALASRATDSAPIAPHSALAFHYFQAAPVSMPMTEPSLNAEPLSSYITSESFVDCSLLDAHAAVERMPAIKQVRHEELTVNSLVIRTATGYAMTTEHGKLTDDAHSEITQRAESALALAREVVRDADTACAAMLLTGGRQEEAVASAAIRALGVTAAIVHEPSATEPSTMRSLSETLRMCLFGLISVFLSCRSETVAANDTRVKRKGFPRLRILHRLDSGSGGPSCGT